LVRLPDHALAATVRARNAPPADDVRPAGIFRSRNETSDISSTFSGVPRDNTPQGHDTELRGSARRSRTTALVEGQADSVTKIAGYGEIDLEGATPTAHSNESSTPDMVVIGHTRRQGPGYRWHALHEMRRSWHTQIVPQPS
jgi:hypothetical protein